jgi:hypothetical protein
MGAGFAGTGAGVSTAATAGAGVAAGAGLSSFVALWTITTVFGLSGVKASYKAAPPKPAAAPTNAVLTRPGPELVFCG